MSQIQYLTQDEFTRKTKELEGGHWTPKSIADRWDYHSRVVELIKSLQIDDARKILEMGTMGITCVHGGDTIDYEERWGFPGKSPTIVHDARKLPWPIADKQYELFIALRVFQHLVPVQRECVREALRIAKRMILVVPSTYDNKHPDLASSLGIPYQDMVSFCDGRHPNVYLPTAMGNLYYYDATNPSNLNIEAVMAPSLVKNTPVAPAPPHHTGIKNKLLSLLKG